MANIEMVELQIAATYLGDSIPKDGSLEDRIRAAMVAVRKADESQIFFMASRKPDDDMKFRTALAAVMLGGSEEDQRIIAASMRPLKALSALMSGIPVDVERMLSEQDDAALPLMKIWHETK